MSIDINALMNDPAVRNNPEYITKLLSDPRLQDPSSGLNMAKTYLERDDALNNYYNEQLSATSKKANSQAVTDAADYQGTIDKLNENLKSDTETLTDTEGQKGTWGSSARAERMGSLVGKYNTSYKDAYNKAVNSANQLGVNQQSLLGSDFSPMNVKQYTATPEGSSVSGMYKYNPFTQKSGSIQGNRAYSLAGLKTGK